MSKVNIISKFQTLPKLIPLYNCSSHREGIILTTLETKVLSNTRTLIKSDIKFSDKVSRVLDQMSLKASNSLEVHES